MRHLFIVGDSISIQYGPFLKPLVESYFHYDRKRGEKQALADLDQPVGANGGDSSRVLDYLTQEQHQGVSYDLLLLNCGLHDIKTDPLTGERQISPARYRDNLEQIIQTARSMAKALIWVSTTDIIDDIHNSQSTSFHRFHRDVLEYNEIASQVMEQHEVPIIDLYTFTLQFGADAYRDHAHFTEEVQRRQAEFIADYLIGSGLHASSSAE
ncbi:SGNH/GDSL hydrolase family protein [Paenibacillus sp. JSM ZJ436]|uniref:SGNH/GDSL hydrolase family protein n=1 Tax=Paenibacillus sp. JSM ZJ436 TaxID=3376190 RepID=UPI0037B3288A